MLSSSQITHRGAIALNQTVTVDVTYPNGDFGTAMFFVNVQNVTGSLTVTPAANPHVVYDANGKPKSFEAGVGFSGTVTAPYVSGGGSFAFVQTMKPAGYVAQYHIGGTRYTDSSLMLLNAQGMPSSPRPIIDDQGGTLYGSQSNNSPLAVGTVSDAGTTNSALSTSDTPGVNISPLSITGDGYTYNTTFMDTLMYLPSGGILVPLGKNSWSVYFDIEKLADGSYQVNAADPITPDGYSPSTDYPNWMESVAFLAATPYKGIYTTSP